MWARLFYWKVFVDSLMCICMAALGLCVGGYGAAQ